MYDNVQASTHEILRMGEINPQLRESEFVERWILTLREYLAGGDVEIVIWLSAQKVTVFGEVDIIDQNGVVLYTVPSLLVKQDNILPKSVASEITDIIHRADALNKNMPGKGDSYMKNELVNHVVEQRKLPEYQQRWDDIFTRYNLEPVFSSSSSQVNDINNDDDYEDFDEYEEL